MASRDEQEVIGQINLLARNAGYRRHQADLPKIRVLLEATGPGNAALAAQLYWDDFIATQALESRNNDDEDTHNDAEAAAAAAPGELADVEMEEAAAPRKSRRTRGSAPKGSHHTIHPLPPPPLFDDDEDDEDDSPSDRMIVEPEPKNASARKGSVEAGTAATSPRKRPPKRHAADDPAVQRLVARAKATMKAVENLVPPKPVPPDEIAMQIEKEPPRAKKPIGQGGFMAEDDWVWQAVDQERDKIPLSYPSSVLWGKAPIAESNEEEEEDEPETPVSVIPLTWLRVGFQLDPETSMGLVLTPPADTDLGYEEWLRANTKRKKKNRPPPPFYCRAITAVLSIVTALLHSGARLESNEITSQPETTTPWTELTVEERKRQFDARLTQALACLLHRAAAVSRKRKLKFLESTRCEEDQRMRQRSAKRKIQRVCPVLGWRMENETLVLPVAGEAVSYATSFTNLDDLQLYVASQLEYFQKPGGVAIFLETLAKIHGDACLRQLLEEVKSPHSSLVHCDCLQRDELAQKQPAKSVGKPHCNCCGVELVSLLLTGTIHTKWQGWATDPLGIGCLTDRAMLSKSLTRPMKPIWLMIGPTVFSVLTAPTDQPDQQRETAGTVVRLEHWNAWYDNRNLTKLRLSMGRHEWKPPHKPEQAFCTEKEPADSQTLFVLEKRRRQRCRIQEEREGLEGTDRNAVFSVIEREAVEPHPDDVKFYPDRFQLWRYDTSHWPCENDSSMSDRKPRGQWVPYHRLTVREKRLVEASMGPAICNILRTRWPTSTLDALEPERPYPVV
eukprot:scaffold3526_cov153-Amphora_coffeaeformis.AAC.7